MPDQISGLLSPWLRRRRFAAARPFWGDGDVLDYGCGVGELAATVPRHRYLGIDRDAESLALARRAHPDHRFVTPEELDAGPPRRFDAVVALALIEHLADPDAWVEETARRLRAGGRLVLTTPEPRLQWAHDLGARLGVFSRSGAEEHQSLIDRRRVGAIAQRAGLDVEVYRRFLLGANQLIVLAKPPASDRSEEKGDGA